MGDSERLPWRVRLKRTAKGWALEQGRRSLAHEVGELDRPTQVRIAPLFGFGRREAPHQVFRSLVQVNVYRRGV